MICSLKTDEAREIVLKMWKNEESTCWIRQDDDAQKNTQQSWSAKNFIVEDRLRS